MYCITVDLLEYHLLILLQETANNFSCSFVADFTNIVSKNDWGIHTLPESGCTEVASTNVIPRSNRGRNTLRPCQEIQSGWEHNPGEQDGSIAQWLLNCLHVTQVSGRRTERFWREFIESEGVFTIRYKYHISRTPFFIRIKIARTAFLVFRKSALPLTEVICENYDNMVIIWSPCN